MAAIKRKYNHPGDIPARQSADYMQQSLQLAGFNVFVHDNSQGLTLDNILDAQLGFTEMDDDNSEMGTTEMGDPSTFYSSLYVFSEMGEIEMGDPEMGGAQFGAIVVNDVDQDVDESFDYTSNWKNTFIVGAQTLGDFADVLAIRETEFRQTILRLKPAESVGILLINYTT